MKEIKMMVIDDEVAEEIKENLEDVRLLGARFSIEAVDTCQDAIDKINILKKKKQFYDVLIVDMKMGDSDEKGLEILKLPLSAIKIVLTAHASVENCVKCLKTGGFDYIDKNSHLYDPYERLKKSIKKGLNERKKKPENPFSTWVNKNLHVLVKEYGGEHIAVIDNTVVDSDKNLKTLKDRVKERYPFLRAEITNIPGSENHRW